MGLYIPLCFIWKIMITDEKKIDKNNIKYVTAYSRYIQSKTKQKITASFSIYEYSK
jgi:hypothetical protein